MSGGTIIQANATGDYRRQQADCLVRALLARPRSPSSWSGTVLGVWFATRFPQQFLDGNQDHRTWRWRPVRYDFLDDLNSPINQPPYDSFDLLKAYTTFQVNGLRSRLGLRGRSRATLREGSSLPGKTHPWEPGSPGNSAPTPRRLTSTGWSLLRRMRNQPLADCRLHQLGDPSNSEIPVDNSHLPFNLVSRYSQVRGYHFDSLTVRDSKEDFLCEWRELWLLAPIHELARSQVTLSHKSDPLIR
jgi:hypothetical protein